MNDSPFTVHGDETLEARIVAWVLGEASAFEEAELERLCQERPELLVFRHRMRALHGLLTESEKQQPDETWKLPAEKRRLLDEIFDQETPIRSEVEKEKRIRHSGRRALMSIAACVVLALVILQLMPWKKVTVAEAVIEIKSSSSGASPLGGQMSESIGTQRMTPQFFGTEFEKLKSRNCLDKVIDNLDLTQRWGVDHETALKRLKTSIETKQIHGTDLVSVRVHESAGTDARDIANEVLNTYKNDRNEMADQNAEKMKHELQQAVRDQEDKLEERRKVLATIVRTKGIVYKGTDSFYGQSGVDEDQGAKNETREEAIRRGLDAQDYVDAKREYETDQELIQQMKLKLIGEQISEKMPRDTVIVHSSPALVENNVSVLEGAVSGIKNWFSKDTSVPAAPTPLSASSSAAIAQNQVMKQPAPAQRAADSEEEIAMLPNRRGLTGMKQLGPAASTFGVQANSRVSAEAASDRMEIPDVSKFKEIAPNAQVEGQLGLRKHGESAVSGSSAFADGGPAPIDSLQLADKDADMPVLQDRSASALAMPSAPKALNDGIEKKSDAFHLQSDANNVSQAPPASAPLEKSKSLNDQDARRDLYLAEGNFNLGKYDAAKLSYENVLKNDPSNAAARSGLEKVEKAQTAYDRTANDHTRAELLSQVDNAWELSVPADTANNKSEVLDESKPEDYEKSDVSPKLERIQWIEEISTADEPYSTFSLNISDASFQIAQAALAKGQRPDPAGVKVEQFYNAVDYGDPAPAAGEPVAVKIEQCAHPVIPGRNLVRVALKTAAAGRSSAQALRLTLLVDQSGSMSREDRRLAMSKAIDGLSSLVTDKDEVTVVGFSRTAHLMAESLSGENAKKLTDFVNLEANEGGTNLEEAIKLASSMALRHKLAGAQNRIVLFTDGAANLGDANPVKLAEHIKQLRQQGIAFDIAGIAADDLNDELLAELARNGNGRYSIIGKGGEDQFAAKLAGAFRPAAENVKVQVRFNPERVAHYKLIGFEKDRLKTEDFRNDAVDAAELAAEEAGVAIYQIEPIANGKGELGEVSVRFRDTAANQMVERTWTIAHETSAPAFDRASPSMQLATFAMLAAEKLKGGPLADAIDFRQLSDPAANVKHFYGSTGRPAEVMRMVDALN